MLEGQPNVTALDLQIKSLRDAALESLSQMASRMREEATDVRDTISDIEDWLDRIKQLAMEVSKKKQNNAKVALHCMGSRLLT